MSKYIIDTGDYLFTTGGVLVVGFDCDNKPATFYNSLDTLEELNSDYINEHFGELQDEAYKQGYADAERIWRAPSSDNEFYQKGLEDGKKSTEKGCEDAVSREVLKDGFTEMCNLICPYSKKQQHVMCGSCLMGTAFDVLEATPSVTPKQRTGKWIHISEETWKCDQCGEISCCSPKYCPDCGSMNEVTE